MTWQEDMEKADEERQSSSVSDFYKFGIGQHLMRVMTVPVKKESRFGHGICYPGAKFCDPNEMKLEYEKKMEKYGEEVEAARKGGATQKELKSIRKPSMGNTTLKWSVWALVRTYRNEKDQVEQINELKIVDLSHTISQQLLALSKDKDMGTNFDSFPMPYDIKIIVKKKDTKGRAWTPKDVEYSLVAGQTRRACTQQELDDMEKKTPIDQIIERMQEKQREEDGQGEWDGAAGQDVDNHSGGIEYPTDDINPDDIPF